MLAWTLGLGSLFVPEAWAQRSRVSSHSIQSFHRARTRSVSPSQRFINQGTLPLRRVNPPLYNPYFSIYFGPLYEPYEEPCYYDEYYGQWIGPCDVSLDTPGYSITVPNRIR